MADYKKGATWPPHRMKLYDERGEPLPLPEADEIEMIAQFGEEIIEGPMLPIDPPEEDPADPDGPPFNAKYNWAAGDTSEPGEYEVEVKITWDAGATPPAIDYVPNGENPTFRILERLG